MQRILSHYALSYYNLLDSFFILQRYSIFQHLQRFSTKVIHQIYKTKTFRKPKSFHSSTW